MSDENDIPTRTASRGKESIGSAETVPAESEETGETLPQPGDVGGEQGALETVDPRRYDIGAEIGKGGMGRILYAKDRRHGRPVAIKELFAAGRRAVRRFEREAMITARLQHPAIVPVYEAGRWPDGAPFYSMKLVSGRALDAVIADADTLEDRLGLLSNIVAVADALAYAHEHDVVHRDLKPSNILIGSFGETVVIDWGLAKILGQEPDEDNISAIPMRADDGHLTMAGQAMGTPAYMPPEQARGDAVDATADVYALGAVLYHALAGCPPHAGSKASEILAKVAEETPTPIQEREPDVPRDLATIVNKAMARRVSDRYQNAGALSADLRRFTTGQLVSAHEYSNVMLARRWLRRHRAVVALATAFLAVLAFTSAFGVRRIIRERNTARAGRVSAQRAERRAEDRHQQLVLMKARDSVHRDPTEALAWLKRYAIAGPGWGTARLIAADAMERGVARHVLRGHTSGLTDVDFSPDGTWIASSSVDGTVRLWDARTGESRVLRGHTSEVTRVAFSLVGDRLASSSTDGEARLWNPTSGESRSLRGHDNVILDLAFSGDGTRLATASFDKTVRVWEVASGESRVLREHLKPVADVAFAPDGAAIASASWDRTVRIWDLASGKSRALRGHDDAVTSVAYSPDGTHLASGSFDKTVRYWDLAKDASRIMATEESEVQLVVISPDGKLLAACTAEGAVSIRRVATGEETYRAAHVGAINTLGFSPDARWLAYGGVAKTAWLVRVATGERRALLGHVNSLADTAFSSGSRVLASASFDGTLRIWPVPGLLPPRVFDRQNEIAGLAAAASAPDVAVINGDAAVWLWDTDTGEAPEVLAATAGGRELALPDEVRRRFRIIRVLVDHSTREIVRPPEITRRAPSVAITRDGQRVFALTADGRMRGWDRARGALQAPESALGWTYDLAMSPDGKHVAAPLPSAAIFLWQPDNGASRELAGHLRGVFNLRFSPDGEWLASAGLDRTVRLWRLAGEETRVLHGHEAWALRVAFSPDSAKVASASWDGTVRVWDVATGEAEVYRGHRRPVWTIAFSPDGTRVASGSLDKTVHVWRPGDGSGQVLQGHEGTITDLAFSPNGMRVVSASLDRTVRLWDLASGESRVLRGHDGRVLRVEFLGRGDRLLSLDEHGNLRLWPDDLPDDPEPLRTSLDEVTSAVLDADNSLGTPLHERR